MTRKEIDITAVDAHLWVDQCDDVLFVVKVVVGANPIQGCSNYLYSVMMMMMMMILMLKLG